MKIDEKIDKYLKEGKNTLYILYGIREDLDQEEYGKKFHTLSNKESIALFTDRSKAESYVKRRMMKKPKRIGIGLYTKFKKEMSGYADYSIEIFDDLDLEINPK